MVMMVNTKKGVHPSLEPKVKGDHAEQIYMTALRN